MSTGTVRAAPDETARLRREQRGWYVYDWACSVYSTSVLTVFLGPYLTSVAERAADGDGYVHPLGVPVRAGSFFAYSVSLSVIVAVVLMPLAGSVADRTGRKKPLLAAAAYTGAAATTGMFLLDGDRYLLGGVLLVVANAAQSVGMMLYNSYLPQIAPPDQRDAVSSRGWALGYAAGSLVLVADLVLYSATTPSACPRRRRSASAWPRPGCGGGPSRSYRCAGCATGTRAWRTPRHRGRGSSRRRSGTCAGTR